MPLTPETEPRAVGDAAARIRQLERQIAQQDQQIAQQDQQIAEGAAQLAAAQAEIAALRQRVQELERSAGLNSSNSGKPPSTDGLGKPPTEPKRTQSLRGRSGKRSGGQPGHKGHTLRPKANPDHVEDHWPGQCQDCGAELSAADQVGEPVRRQVFDLPAPAPLEATEHRAHACVCGQCGTRTRAAFPEGVKAPTQYGPRISAVVVYLQNQHFVPEQRLAEILLDLFGVKVSTGTLAAMTSKAAERWADFAAQVRDRLRSTVPVKHLDETGFRIAGRLHVICTSLLTFYYVGPERGAVLSGLSGCLVHDHWQTYFKRPGVLHALCNAHHLRELKALAELDGEGWARRMQQLLTRARRAVRLARARGDPLPASLLERILRRYDQLVAQALAYHRGLEPLPSGRRGRKKRRKGHNLALRLRDRKLAVLRFLVDFTVPFTNNQAEQDMRMMKLRMKISGCFRTARGARDFALLRSVLSTARKQGWNRIETLMKTPDELLAALRL